MDGPAGDGPQSNAAPRGPGQSSSGPCRLQPGEAQHIAGRPPTAWACLPAARADVCPVRSGRSAPGAGRGGRPADTPGSRPPAGRRPWSGWAPAADGPTEQPTKGDAAGHVDDQGAQGERAGLAGRDGPVPAGSERPRPGRRQPPLAARSSVGRAGAVGPGLDQLLIERLVMPLVGLTDGLDPSGAVQIDAEHPSRNRKIEVRLPSQGMSPSSGPTDCDRGGLRS
jgi:hypothetical protein